MMLKAKLEKKVSQFEELCRRKGLRLTHQRLEILKELVADTSHPSAEDVYNRIVKRLPMISLDTVYRTIALFEEHGLVKRVEILDDRSRFDSNLEKHHHLVCVRCKRIEDFYWSNFDSLRAPNNISSWGIVQSKHVELRGLCKACMKKEKRKKP